MVLTIFCITDKIIEIEIAVKEKKYILVFIESQYLVKAGNNKYMGSFGAIK